MLWEGIPLREQIYAVLQLRSGPINPSLVQLLCKRARMACDFGYLRVATHHLFLFCGGLGGDFDQALNQRCFSCFVPFGEALEYGLGFELEREGAGLSLRRNQSRKRMMVA